MQASYYYKSPPPPNYDLSSSGLKPTSHRLMFSKRQILCSTPIRYKSHEITSNLTSKLRHMPDFVTPALVSSWSRTQQASLTLWMLTVAYIILYWYSFDLKYHGYKPSEIGNYKMVEVSKKYRPTALTSNLYFVKLKKFQEQETLNRLRGIKMFFR